MFGNSSSAMNWSHLQRWVNTAVWIDAKDDVETASHAKTPAADAAANGGTELFQWYLVGSSWRHMFLRISWCCLLWTLGATLGIVVILPLSNLQVKKKLTKRWNAAAAATEKLKAKGKPVTLSTKSWRDLTVSGEQRTDESENSQERYLAKKDWKTLWKTYPAFALVLASFLSLSLRFSSHGFFWFRCHSGRWNRDTPHFQWTRGMKLGSSGRYVVKKKARQLHTAKTEDATDATKLVGGQGVPWLSQIAIVGNTGLPSRNSADFHVRYVWVLCLGAGLGWGSGGNLGGISESQYRNPRANATSSSRRRNRTGSSSTSFSSCFLGLDFHIRPKKRSSVFQPVSLPIWVYTGRIFAFHRSPVIISDVEHKTGSVSKNQLFLVGGRRLIWSSSCMCGWV